jgi:hypothetical protein
MDMSEPTKLVPERVVVAVRSANLGPSPERPLTAPDDLFAPVAENGMSA